MEYLTRSYTPMSKTIWTAGPNTTLTVWAPGADKKIGLTDIIISTQAGVAGTMQLYQYPGSDLTATPTLVMEFIASSANANNGFSKSFATPILVSGNNGVLRIVASFSGFTAINCLGFEQS